MTDKNLPVNVTQVKILVLKSHEKMGKLISDIVNQEVKRPDSIQELDAILYDREIVDKPSQAEEASGTPPHWPNGRPSKVLIDYVTVDDDQLMILLPSANALKAGMYIAQQESRNGEYPLPVEYDRDYVDPTRKSTSSTPPMTPSDWDVIYDARIGDYTCNKCM